MKFKNKKSLQNKDFIDFSAKAGLANIIQTTDINIIYF
ncbi:hypothetical protein yinte0001_33820 [Yersinia intermedia ATCC 29909]|nr:hypothetical protein yinte0001_33820 [Yersinia intermedia ATCC 29909]